MNNFNKIKPVIFNLIFILLIAGCKKFVTAPPPENLLVNSNVFTSDANATSAMMGIYSNMTNGNGGYGFATGNPYGVSLLAGLSADELINYQTTSSNNQFYINNILSTNTTITNSLWGSAYQYIYSANELIKGINNSTAI